MLIYSVIHHVHPYERIEYMFDWLFPQRDSFRDMTDRWEREAKERNRHWERMKELDIERSKADRWETTTIKIELPVDEKKKTVTKSKVIGMRAEDV